MACDEDEVEPLSSTHQWIVKRRDIPSYFTNDFWEAFDVYINYKNYGNPFEIPWPEWPCHILDVLNLFENEQKIYVAEKGK